MPTHASDATPGRPIDDAEPVVAVDDLLSTLDTHVRSMDDGVRRFVVERPFVALAGAIAGGFLIGRLLSR